jgi:hypothetical protein
MRPRSRRGGGITLTTAIAPDVTTDPHIVVGVADSLYAAGEHTIGELEELFSITRSTVYRAISRSRVRATS